MAGGLRGRQVLVTRPAAQAGSLCARIAELGGTPVCFPLIEILPPEETSAFERTAAAFDDYDLAFFVSPNAVQYGLDGLLAHRPWPAGLKVATVGQGSAQALRARGFAEVIVPAAGFDSEAVLALPEFGADAVNGRRVLILRGDGGRPLLGDTLRARGARVDYLNCYRRRAPTRLPRALLACAQAGELHAISLTSSKAVGNLLALLDPDGMRLLSGIPVFAPHPRIAEHARKAGFSTVFETPPADEGLVQALDSHLPTSLG